jgi:hypothetical protein
VAEHVLFGSDETIDEFVDRYAGQNLTIVRALLEEGERRGDLRHVEPMFLIPSLIGGCVFFFLAAPVVERLFGLGQITPELAQRLADHTVDVLLHGIETRPEEAPA